MTVEKQNFLLEIGTEELPASYIQPSLDQLRSWGEKWAPPSAVIVGGTPRRLFLFIKNLRRFETETVFGPPLDRAKDENGLWNKNASGFVRSQGKTVNDLGTGIKNGKKYLKLEVRIDRQLVLRDELIKLLGSLVFPKAMRWIPGSAFSFARPIRWLVFLWGPSVTDVRVAGVESGRHTRGHRFFGDDHIRLLSADVKAYRRVLRDQYVLVDPAGRRKKLVEGILKKQEKFRPGIGETDLDAALLDEVCNLVEYPRVIVGDFSESFLTIPSQVLITVMKSHQRYFPVRDAGGRLLPKFIVVADGPFKKTGPIRENNERVLKARLADAGFFWEEDLSRSLEDRVSDLEGMIFHARLGTYREKVRRVERLARAIAEELKFSVNRIERVKRSAHLCKSDLTTAMVTEFTELQGTMGMEYARRQGEEEEVARAIYEHYLPRSAEDALPETETGTVLALADKLDTVASFLSAGITPSGSQDPYGLRRQAQGIIRLLAEKKLPLPFDMLAKKAVEGLALESSQSEKIIHLILDFFRLRLEAFLESRDIPPDIIEAVLAIKWADIQDTYNRCKMIKNLNSQKVLLPATTIVERTSNIVKSLMLLRNDRVHMNLFQEQAELNLYKAFQNSIEQIKGLIRDKKYKKATEEYVKAFSSPLSTFFNEVMVNVVDEKLRKNRMMLLNCINRLYTDTIADLSLLQFERGEYIAPIVTFIRLEVPTKIRRGMPFKIKCVFSLNSPVFQDHRMFVQLYRQNSTIKLVDMDVDLSPQINEWDLAQEVEVKTPPVKISLNAPLGTYVIRAGLHYFKGRKDKGDFKQPYTNSDIQKWEIGTIKVVQ